MDCSKGGALAQQAAIKLKNSVASGGALTEELVFIIMP
jgi:hypothetical protein